MAHMMLLALYHCSCSYDSIVWLCLKIFLFRIAGVFCFDSWFASLVCLRCFSSQCLRLHDIIIIYRFHSEVARLRLWALQMSAICLARELGLRLFVHGSSGSLSLSPGVRATFPIRAINGRMGALASFFHANSAEVPAANSIAVPADDAVAVFHVQHVLGGLPLHQKLLPLPAWHLLLKFGEREHSFCTYIIPHFADKGGVLMYISKQSDEATAWWVHIYLYIYIYLCIYIHVQFSPSGDPLLFWHCAMRPRANLHRFVVFSWHDFHRCQKKKFCSIVDARLRSWRILASQRWSIADACLRSSEIFVSRP